MRSFTLFVILFLFISNISEAQILRGKITNQAGDPVQYATVYIQELRQGTTANTRGDYELKLPAGKYTVTYQSLGYQPFYVTINLTSSGVQKDVILPTQYYEIPEVRISATGEDPAYSIMRKAIGMAPYYLNNISYYKAEVYLKGNLIINKIPRLLQKSMKIGSSSVSVGSDTKPEEKSLKAGDTFLMESFNEIEFKAPDSYVQRMISYNSTFPSQGNEISPMSFIQASFYQPVLADMAISPLAVNAFSHYRYKYLGASLQGNITINKIQVIPKRKSQQLFEGIIYIIEDLWCLQSLDLTNENFFGKIRVQQIFIPVQDDIWLPVSHKFEINIGIIGFKADVGYGSSVKYLEVKPNLALRKPAGIASDFEARQASVQKSPDTTLTRSKKQINKILEKDQLSNRDMAKLARLMEKESEASLGDSTKKNLEITDKTKHIVEKDANRKDSTYWANIRPIPLSDNELRSIRISDSLTRARELIVRKADTTNSSPAKGKSKFVKTAGYIISGHTWSDKNGFRFTFNGLIDLKKVGFNSVDGFRYGTNFNMSKTWKKNETLFIAPDIRWAFNRKALIWGVNGNYMFNRTKNSQIFFRTGKTSKDINDGTGLNQLINTASSLFLKKNYLRLYESEYLTLGYSTEIINGLTVNLSADYDRRRVLSNSTNFSFLRSSEKYSENTPVNMYLGPGSNGLNALRNQEHYDFIVQAYYTPNRKYRMYKGSKVPEGSDWPTFNFTWQHSLNDFSEIQHGIRHFDLLKFEVSRSSDIGAFSHLSWKVKTGGYLDNRNLTFYDFFHFNTQSFPLLLNSYEDVFMIPSFYSMSTPEAFVEGHIKYTTPYLLLKLLPGLSNTLMRENISLATLSSRYNRNYTEVGYSISEILFMGEVGIYAGFDDFRYRSIGLRAIFNFH
jgi:hypothetical protein